MANLTQLRMIEKLDGYLLVDKPEGLAFTTVVKTVKRKFNLVKVGHGGSLDALASGLLVLLVGDANKFADRVMGADRVYTGTMRLGLATNTHDIYGESVAAPAAAPLAVSPEEMAAAKAEFTGDVFQTESRFSTIRKEGSAAYEIADTGEHAAFMAHVYRFAPGEVRSDARGTHLDFALAASKGVLVKTLVNDFGARLGCGAALEALRRTRIGKFEVEKAIPFAKLLELELKDFASVVMPLSKALA